jgi:DNA-binding LytR/AlgR family response regulator
MKIEVKIEASCREPRVIVVTDKMTDEVNMLLKRLSDEAPRMIAGFRGDAAAVLEQEEIIRVYAEAGRVVASAESGKYSLRLRLYELEERLDRNRFVRISNSEIINLRKVKSFDLSLSGTICVTFSNGESAYVSRRYVGKIKQVLGI